MTVDIFYVGISILIFNINYGLAVPHEYCLSPLNRSDCGTPPTPVFSYYKPGSRCEIEFWRGCPTNNKFNDEFICSHYCIGKLYRNNEIEDGQIKDETKDICAIPLDTNDCGAKPTTVYTYDGNTCQNTTWKGCASVNMFDDYIDCLATCQPSLKDSKDEVGAPDKDQCAILLADDNNKCAILLDTGDCGAKPTTVYTYDGNTCKNVTWKGCTSVNMFDDFNSCLAKCQPLLKEWKDEIETLNKETVAKIDDILEEVLEMLTVEIQVTEKMETTTLRQKLIYELPLETTTNIPTPAPTTEAPFTSTHYGEADEFVTV